MIGPVAVYKNSEHYKEVIASLFNIDFLDFLDFLRKKSWKT